MCAKRKEKAKRDYSRGGCRECKRRKIKCDEVKPTCLQCARLSKACTYPAAGEKVLRVSKRYLEDNPNQLRDAKRPGVQRPFTIQLYLGPEDFVTKRAARASDSPGVKDEPIEAAASVDSSLDGALDAALGPSPSLAPEFVTLPPVVFETGYNHNDLHVIATDLNSIVNDIIFQSNFPDSDAKLAPNTVSVVQSSSAAISDEIPRNVSINRIVVNEAHEKLYLEDFFHGFAMQILPFGSYDHELKVYLNPLRDVLLKYASYEPFLLAAILAQGARTSYNKNKLQRDQEAYCSYLSTCLQLLGPALSNNRDKKVKDDLISNIECILLTVLLLTSANATTTKQSWRPHLKGAKDLIIKATNGKIRLSKTLILCKIWFIDFEILAGTSSFLGGTLKTDDEIDSVMQFNSEYEIAVLREFGILRDDGFIIMCGYNLNCLYLFRDLIKIINEKRRDGEYFRATDCMEYLRLLAGFLHEYEVEYVDRKCVLPSEFVPQEMVLPDLMDVVTTSRDKVVVSWMDLTQQAYALAAIIHIYTAILELPYDHANIQELNHRLIELILFLVDCHGVPHQHIVYSILMIQWPMLIAALHCINEDHKYLLMKFFRILVELGSGSAELALKRIVRYWELRDSGYGADDEIHDIVAY